MDRIQALIEETKKQRAAFAALSTVLGDVKAAFATTHAELIASVAKAKTDLEIAEEALRTEAIATYEKTGAKKIADGVGVRLVKELVYKPDDALQWAKHHDMCLALDVKAFETLAKTQRLDFVAILEAPQGTISKEL